MKGVFGAFPEESIMKELSEMNIDQINLIKVKALTKELDPNKPATYLVILSNDSVMSNLTSIRKLMYQSIRWVSYRKNKIFQCRNCQLTDHSSKNCSLKYRCVKCTDEHKPGECPKKDLPDSVPQCVNCGKEGHPASFRGCEFLMFAEEKYQARKTNSDNKRVEKAQKIHQQVKPNLSCRNVVANDNNTSQSDFPRIPQRGYNVHKQLSIEDLLDEHAKKIIDSLSDKIGTIANKVDVNSRKIEIIAEKLQLSWI